MGSQKDSHVFRKVQLLGFEYEKEMHKYTEC